MGDTWDVAGCDDIAELVAASDSETDEFEVAVAHQADFDRKRSAVLNVWGGAVRAVPALKTDLPPAASPSSGRGCAGAYERKCTVRRVG